MTDQPCPFCRTFPPWHRIDCEASPAKVGEFHPYEWCEFDDQAERRSEFLILANGHHVGIGYGQLNNDESIGGTQWWDEGGDPIEPEPTHWMKKPEGPREG